MLIRLPISCVLEVRVYKRLEFLHKRMMSLPCSSIPSHNIGQAQLKKFPVFYSITGDFREELMIEDGIILKGTQIVIPAKKCKAVLKLMHEGHLGLNKCKLHAKETVYWPGLNDQFEKLILNCKLCLKYSYSKCKQKPSMSLGQEITMHPWSNLVTDIFHFEDASYLLIVGLHKQVSNCVQLIFNDWATCRKSEQADICRILLA